MWSTLQPEPLNAHNWYGPPWQNDTSITLPSSTWPAQWPGYQPSGYINHSSSNFDPRPMPHQLMPFISVNYHERNQKHDLAYSRHYDRPLLTGHALEDQRPLQQSLPSTVALGPPLKPRRSGHALWVGNLHRNTSIIRLKDHFSDQMTEDIESVFLISRSTCAFINYRSEEACKIAAVRFRSTKLDGKSLVCRIRRNQVPDGGLVPSSLWNAQRSSSNSEEDTPKRPVTPVIVGSRTAETSSPPISILPISAKVPEKFFVLKSFTVQDLEASVRKSSWVTQRRNEAALNTAFKEAETVYLIFSANRSGEYFGYARMTSAILVDKNPSSPTSPTDIAERAGLVAPKYTYTPATLSAPAGWVVDDLERGTLFWEACSLENDGSQSMHSERSSPFSTEENLEENVGNAFSIEWLCVTKLPFVYTRGLRNPWNANREVKIARDGTEIEPRAGRRLLELFREQSGFGQMQPWCS